VTFEDKAENKGDTTCRGSRAGTPKAIISKLNTANLKIIKSDAFAKKMRAAGCGTMGSTPQDFAKLIAEDATKFAKIAQAGHIAAQ